MKIDRIFSVSSGESSNKTQKTPRDSAALQQSEQEDQKLRQAAQLYEQHFIGEMVKAMRQAVPEGGLMESNFAEKIFREQLDQQYVENWGKRGGVGLADMIYHHIKERYFPVQGGPRPQGPLPLESRPGGLHHNMFKIEVPQKTDNKQIKFIFRGQGSLAKEDGIVLAPWEGKVTRQYQTQDGYSFIQLQHASGLNSTLVFQGSLSPQGPETHSAVQAGQKLGQLDLQTPWLSWSLTSNS